MGDAAIQSFNKEHDQKCGPGMADNFKCNAWKNMASMTEMENN
jgi:hypothetical protein